MRRFLKRMSQWGWVRPAIYALNALGLVYDAIETRNYIKRLLAWLAQKFWIPALAASVTAGMRIFPDFWAASPFEAQIALVIAVLSFCLAVVGVLVRLGNWIQARLQRSAMVKMSVPLLPTPISSPSPFEPVREPVPLTADPRLIVEGIHKMILAV